MRANGRLKRLEQRIAPARMETLGDYMDLRERNPGAFARLEAEEKERFRQYWWQCAMTARVQWTEADWCVSYYNRHAEQPGEGVSAWAHQEIVALAERVLAPFVPAGVTLPDPFARAVAAARYLDQRHSEIRATCGGEPA